MAQANLSEGSNIFTDLGFVVGNSGKPSLEFYCNSVTNAITSTASSGVALTSEFNIISTANSTTTFGVSLPAIVQNGLEVRVINNGGTIQTVYPPTGGTIDGGSVNAGVTLAAAANSGKTFIQTGSLTYVTASLT